MEEPATSDNPQSATARLEAWRTTILNGLTRIFFAGGLLLFLGFAAPLIRAGTLGPPLLLAAFTVTLGLCALPSGSVRLRSRVFLLAATLYATVMPYFAGITGGIGLAGGLVTIFAVVLLGRRDAIVLAAFILVMWSIWWMELRSGGISPPRPELSDTGRPESALRVIATAIFILPICLLATDYLIRKLVGTANESDVRLGLLNAQMEALRSEVERRQRAETKAVAAQKMELLAKLAGGVAHDVNNNLTVVRFSADLLMRAESAHARRDLMEAIVGACDNATLLTRQLLAIGRREVSRREPVSVGDTLERLRRMMRATLRGDITLKVSLQDGLPNVNVDPAQFVQAVMNLVLNARDAMTGGGCITLSAEHRGSPIAYDLVTSETGPANPVRIHVQDEGTGIAPDVLGKILDPFFTTKPGASGSGLGLSMVRAFVETSGGRLGVRSTWGGGAIFTLELEPTSLVRASTAPSASPSAATILIVDDDDRVRAVLVRTLREAGYTTIDVGTGEEALAHARGRTEIHLLCTDAHLPGLQGEELVRRFRAERPAIPILICSAYIDDAKLRAWIEMDALPVVRKPFARDELVQAVASALTTSARSLPKVATSDPDETVG